MPRDRALIEAARRGERSAARELTDRLSPVVRARVRRVLGRRNAQDGADLIHELWVWLCEDDWRRLLDFEEERNPSLEGYVGFIAERQAINRLELEAAQKRGGTTTLLLLDEAVFLASAEPDPEGVAITRQALNRLERFLIARLTIRDRLILRFLYADHRDPIDVARALGLEVQVIYKARQRIQDLAREHEASSSTPQAAGS